MRKLEFELQGKVSAVSLERKEDHYLAETEGKSLAVHASRTGSNLLILEIDGRKHSVFFAREGNGYLLSIGLEQYSLTPHAAVSAQSNTTVQNQQQADRLVAPMPGKVIKILCREGERVKAGQTLAVIEAMKMETHLAASRDAEVKKIPVKEGNQVKLSETLIEFELE